MNIERLISEMTLEEKASLCSGATNWMTKRIKKYDIQKLFMANGPYGVLVIDTDVDTSIISKLKKIANITSKLLKIDDSPLMGKVRPSTSFPCSTSIASTWNIDLIEDLGKAIAEECIEYGVDILLGPGVNIKRSPLCGRNFEYYSEDPCLAGEIGAAFVNGVQSKGVATSLKHFALNNAEYRRFSISSMVDERTLREIYLNAFERVIQKANPWTIMASYNKVNNEYASENSHLLKDILKEEWGYDGLVMSDWGAVNDRVKALNAGLDLQMPGPQDRDDHLIIQAVKNGQLDIQILNETVRRLLTLIERVSTKKKTKADFEKNHKLAIKVAEEGIVLLKNNHNLLPLSVEKINSMAIIGEVSKEPFYLKGGSAFLSPIKTTTPYASISEYLGNKCTVRYAQGYDSSDTLNETLIDEAVKTAKQSDYSLIMVRTASKAYAEGNDRADINLPEQQIKLIKEVSSVQPNTIVAVICGSAFETYTWEKDVSSLLSVWHAGQGIGEAIKNIIFGITNPSGKLPETFPIKLSDTPAYINGPLNDDKMNYGENIFIGYRYYDKKEMAVSYPFGHGLSFTSFEYSSLRFSSNIINKGDTLSVSFTVKNTGRKAGKEVVQLYVRDPESYLPRPEKELKAFKKIQLEAGEEKDIVINLSERDFSYYYSDKHAWVAENGEFEIQIGSSSRDIRLTGKVQLQNADAVSPGLQADSTLGDWYFNEEGRKALKKSLGTIFFNLVFNEESPFFPIITSVPLIKAVKNNYITYKQCEAILNYMRQ